MGCMNLGGEGWRGGGMVEAMGVVCVVVWGVWRGRWRCGWRGFVLYLPSFPLPPLIPLSSTSCTPSITKTPSIASPTLITSSPIPHSSPDILQPCHHPFPHPHTASFTSHSLPSFSLTYSVRLTFCTSSVVPLNTLSPFSSSSPFHTFTPHAS